MTPPVCIGNTVQIFGPAQAVPIAAIVTLVRPNGSINAQLFDDRHGAFIYMEDVPHVSDEQGDLVWRFPQ